MPKKKEVVVNSIAIVKPIKTEAVRIGGEDKLKLTYEDGREELRSL